MSNSKDKYVFIIYEKSKDNKNELKFATKNLLTEIIYSDKNEKDDYYYMIFKYLMKENKKPEKKVEKKIATEQNVNLEFNIGEENYTIEFCPKNLTFIYEPKLTKNDILYKTKKPIKQDKLSDSEKFCIFYKALTKETNNEELIKIFYEDSIKLYGNKPTFELLINIFVKIYNNEPLSILLFKEFRKNIKKEVDVKSENLMKFQDIFQEIDDNLKKKFEKINDSNNNNYFIDYYGIILCYLNNYDYDKFLGVVKHLYSQEDNSPLFEILLIYKSFFKKDLKVDEKLFEDFINFTAGRTFNELTESGLVYLKNLKLFLKIINNIRNKLVSIDNFKPLKLTNFEKKIESKDIKDIVSLLKDLIDFSEEEFKNNNKKLLLNISDKFWENLINICNSATKQNIELLSDLRIIFEKYLKLSKDLDQKSDLYKNANDFNKKDKIDSTLHNNILDFIKKAKEISNIQIINFIMKRDPYYITEKNINKRDFQIILDKIDFNNLDKEFIEQFKEFNFEIIFKKNIIKYLASLFEKINNWEIFDNIFNLIKPENLGNYLVDLISFLEKKYKDLIKFKNINLNDKDIDKKIEFLSYLTDFLYINKKDFYKNEISKLNVAIRNKIYIKLFSFCTNEQHNNMSEYIKDYYIKSLKIENLDEFIIFLEKLKFPDYLDVINRINNKYKIDHDVFYSSEENIKIILLCKLNDKNLLKSNEEDGQNANNYYDNTYKVLYEISKDIDDKKIKISQLKTLFSSKKIEYIEGKFRLFKIINSDISENYKSLKEEYDGINNKILDLNKILTNLEKYFSKYHQKDIENISKLINSLENQDWSNYENNIKNIGEFDDLKGKSDKIESVKNLILFGILYRNTTGEDQDKHFVNALNKLNNISEILKSNKREDKPIIEEIRKNNTKINEEIEKYIQQKNTDDELSLLVNFDSYENDIKSMFYFFDNLPTINEKDDENWNKILLPKYKEITKMNMKSYLKDLKDKKLYDYLKESKSHKSYYIRLFNCLYKKQEAYDFLKQKHENLNLLYEKLDPNVQNLTAKEIGDAISCYNFFGGVSKIKKELILNEIISKLDENLIKSFESFAQNYQSIIELNQNFDDFSLNLYDEVAKLLKNTTIKFFQNSEEINIGESSIDPKKYDTINKLLILKNKIHVKPRVNINNSENEQKILAKNNTLLLFKEHFTNIETIYEYLTIMRTKGNILPLVITIELKDQNVKYYINDKNDKSIEKKFNEIDKILSNIKTEINKQLESYYKKDEYIRFFYGKQIINIVNHLNAYIKLTPFLRYILNDINSKTIKEGAKKNDHAINDYISYYSLYIKETFENISNYVISLLNNNNSNLEEHYNKMKIKDKDTLKGIYFFKSESESMEEDILQIFLDKIGCLPIAQNILITNKETSYEEMQAFTSRAILCQYHSLFVIEINESFSDNQQRILNKFLDKILIYKCDSYNKLNNKSTQKSNTSEYIDSCLVFVFNEKNESSLNYISRTIKKQELELNEKHELDITNPSIDLVKTESTNISFNSSRIELKKSVHVVKSEVCGLGKSNKIRKDILKSGKEPIHFPIGGNITRNILYKKLQGIFDLLKDKDLKKIAIHLDLYENNEPSIMNEFLFSLLITKFYSISENIIFIPKDIEIYVEVPNCFEDFISKYKILNSFDIENITFESKPPIELSVDKKLFFSNMLNTDDNNKIAEYINKHIKISNYSYHQLNIFTNLFISQYRLFGDDGKPIRFLDENNEDITTKIIEIFADCTKYFTSGSFANLLVNKEVMNKFKGNNKEYIELLAKTYKNDLDENEKENDNFKYPLIFIRNRKQDESGNTKGVYFNLYISKNHIGLYEDEKEKADKKSKEKKNEKEKKKNERTETYVEIFKEILGLDTPIDKFKEIFNDGYVITDDNFRKMVLILYRVIANIPVILMGETGCGKTALIKKLYQLLNNGKDENLIVINIHPGITDDYLYEKMIEINKIAEGKKDQEFWIFFDELNTCDSFSLLTEIYCNRSFLGKKLCDNIKILGACNPYRLREKGKVKCGLSHPDDKYDELVYLVKLLPQSLMYYVFNFGSINPEDEAKYISSIISKHFKKNEEDNLKEETKNIISECHKFLRTKFDPSTVSLREISRFSKCLNFFMDYYKKKNLFLKERGNEKIEKIKSIINSIYICYYIRLNSSRNDFDRSLQEQFVQLVNWNSKAKIDEKEKSDLFSKISNNDFVEDIKKRKSNFSQFSDIINLEENFILERIELEKGIGLSRSLRENIFLLFVSLETNIPLIIIGKPGSGKSLSSHLIYKSMKGKYSNDDFFKLYPSIIQSYFQGSNSTTPDDVSNVFRIAEKKLESFQNKNSSDIPISMLLFDELGLAERSKSNPLKVLHAKLDEYFNEHIQENQTSQKRVCFVGISNWSLDAAKLNRALSLSVPDLDESLDDLIEISTTIAKSFNDNFAKLKKENENQQKKLDNIDETKKVPIFENLLPSVYFFYKKTLMNLKELTVKKQYDEKYKNNNNTKLQAIKDKEVFKKMFVSEKEIKVDFHGNRDYFHLIKGVARDLSETNEIDDSNSVVESINKCIERNFGGMEIKININEKDILEADNYIKNIIEKSKDNKNVITSVKFFKCIYNSFIDENDESKERYKNYKLNNIDKYDRIKCIYDNINDENSRYLLLKIKQSLALLIHQNIKKKLNQKKNVIFYEGSPFIGDEDMEYQYSKLNDVQDQAKNPNGNLLILQNLNSIYPFLYDLFNMNYQVKDGKNYARICHGNYSDQLALINPFFRILIMVDKKFIDKMESPFLNRFEKINIEFDELLNECQKNISKDLIKNECDFGSMIKNKITNKLSYNIEDLLIGCDKEDIRGLVYDFSKDEQIDYANDKDKVENIKREVIKKLSKLLPQDFIVNLPDDEKIKEEYFKNKEFYNIKDYIEKKNDIYKISIIYTFTNYLDSITIMDEYGDSILISDIKSERDLRKKIETIIINIRKIKKRYIYLRFVQSNSGKLSFIIPFLMDNFDFDKEHIYFICIIHIKRNFYDKASNNIKADKIYNIPNLYHNVDQLFIDNLDVMNEGDGSKKLNLKNILQEDVKGLLSFINLNSEFTKTLKLFINNTLGNKTKLLKGENDTINQENYFEKLSDYFKNNDKFMEDINEKAKSFIEYKGNDLIKLIYEKKLFNKNSVDIILIILDYIKDKLISQYILDIFYNLEDNNFFTSLLVLYYMKQNTNYINDNENEIQNSNDIYSYDELIENIKSNCLNNLKYKQKDKYDLKFDLNYKLPGFYYIFVELSKLILKSYSSRFKQNERTLRLFVKGSQDNAEANFISSESDIINQLYDELNNEEYKEILIMLNIIKNNENLFLDDYITFYLDKNYNKENLNQSHYLSFGEVNHKLIHYILKMRFKINEEQNEDDENNDDYNLKSILKKLCWLESNINYIIGILDIYKELKGNFEKEKEDKLFELMKYNIETLDIKYITNKEKNPKVTSIVNECYYKLLASIIYCILPPNIDFKKKNTMQLNYYIDSVKVSVKILENLNDNLYIYLNEMYILDEFLKIYETLEINNKVELNYLNIISTILKKNSEIIQNNPNNYIKSLIENYKELYKNLNEKLEYRDTNYYSLLKYIFFKEIKRIKDPEYRKTIFADIKEENEVIKNSMDILQLLLKDKVKPNKKEFLSTINNLLNDESEISQMMENVLKNKTENNYFTLSETLLYFFEKNSHNYINKILNEYEQKDKNKVKITLDNEKEPLKLFKDSIKNLEEYEEDKNKDKKRNLAKLFSIAYIKSYCHFFISYIEKNDKENLKSPEIIINVIESSKNKNLSKMITLYIYKIIYNHNNKDAYLFSLDDFKAKYKLDKFKKNNIKIKEDDNDLSIQFNLDKNYENMYTTIEKYKYGGFKKTDIKEIDTKDIDKFIFVSNNLVLKCLVKKDYEKSETFVNFNKNVCNILFKDSPILKGINLFYDPIEISKIRKDFNINNDTLLIMIYSYRYFINEIASNSNNSIYGLFYDKKRFKEISKYYYPGNDIRNIQIYDLYTKIINHLYSKSKQKQGCFVCMCKNECGYYYSTRDDEPSDSDLNKKCDLCQESVGSVKDRTRTIAVKRENYFRILKKDDYDYKHKREFNEYDYKTIDDFIMEYMEKKFEEEKGITIIDENHLKKDNKIIRNLSQVSYRLLNFILYSHLFFARLYTKDNSFDNYLPSKMSWGQLINLLWEILKNKLFDEGITNIELFMNFVFLDIFKMLNETSNIKEYQAFKKIELSLDTAIKDKISEFKRVYKQESKNKNEVYENNDENNEHFMYNLLKEKYIDLEIDGFPFYKNFFYSDYIDENYLLSKLNIKDREKYPVLLKVLEASNNPKTDKYSLTNLESFKELLNLFYDNYSYKISRKEASETKIKDSDIYGDNIEKINKFIKFYNGLKIKVDKKLLTLDPAKNNLNDLFIDDDSDIGRSYKSIFNEFIKKQNNELTPLLDIKIDKEIFDKNCKKPESIQNLNEKEIFTLNIQKKNFSFIDIIFNNSYRRALIENDYKLYNEYIIDFDSIEERVTDLLLKNKKILNDTIISFVYKNEDLIFENSNAISIFNNNQTAENIDINDKVILYEFYNEHYEDTNLLVQIVEDFIQLIIFLNNNRNNNKLTDKISGSNEISNIFDHMEQNISDEFKEIFEGKKNLTINKIVNLLEYYIRIIFVNSIKKEFEEFQEKNLKEKKIENIKKYFNNDKLLINQNIFRNTIRLLITIFLNKIEEKDEKIKNNTNNIANYLDIKDIWIDISTKKSEYKEELKKIKNLKIQINQILEVYDLLNNPDDDDEKYFKNVIKEIENKKAEQAEEYSENNKTNEEEEPNEDENQNEEEEPNEDEIQCGEEENEDIEKDVD